MKGNLTTRACSLAAGLLLADGALAQSGAGAQGGTGGSASAAPTGRRNAARCSPFPATT
jgi:hypothetical protein